MSDVLDDAYDEGYEDGLVDAEGVEESEIHDMTEEEAFSTYELAFALGLGEEISLEEADRIRAEAEMRVNERGPEPTSEPISIKEAKARGKSRLSSVTNKPKCPFEQWIKDVCAGKKSIHDPIGGENSYGKEDGYDLFSM
jgi:hypothetical protein